VPRTSRQSAQRPAPVGVPEPGSFGQRSAFRCSRRSRPGGSGRCRAPQRPLRPSRMRWWIRTTGSSSSSPSPFWSRSDSRCSGSGGFPDLRSRDPIPRKARRPTFRPRPTGTERNGSFRPWYERTHVSGSERSGSRNRLRRIPSTPATRAVLPKNANPRKEPNRERSTPR